MSATLDQLAMADSLLVVSDFDGTLVPFGDDPYNVTIVPESKKALYRLAALPRTTVVVLSGRDVGALARVSGLLPPIHLAGSHGAEWDHDTLVLSEEQKKLLDWAGERLEEIVAPWADEGAFVEYKPFHRGIHVRKVKDTKAQERMLAAAEAMAKGTKLHTTMGKCVAEFAVASVTKGTWIAAEKKRTNPSAVVFLGDDTTDERGFLVLGNNDLGIKVGDGDTAATMRVQTLDDVAAFLTKLAFLRELNAPRGAE